MVGILEVDAMDRCDAMDGARVREAEPLGEETSRKAGSAVRAGDGKECGLTSVVVSTAASPDVEEYIALFGSVPADTGSSGGMTTESVDAVEHTHSSQLLYRQIPDNHRRWQS